MVTCSDEAACPTGIKGQVVSDCRSIGGLLCGVCDKATDG